MTKSGIMEKTGNVNDLSTRRSREDSIGCFVTVQLTGNCGETNIVGREGLGSSEE